MLTLSDAHMKNISSLSMTNKLFSSTYLFSSTRKSLNYYSVKILRKTNEKKDE